MLDDTNSASFLGGILLLVILIIAFIIYLILKKYINKNLLLGLIFIILGYVLSPLKTWNYLFYIAGAIFLIIFFIDLIKRRVKKK